MDESNGLCHLDRSTCRWIYDAVCESLFEPGNAQKYQHPKRFYSRQLVKLECFVDDLISCNEEVPFVPRLSASGHREYDFTSTAETYFGLIPDFIDVVNMLSPAYEYNEHISLFKSCCESLGLLGMKLDWGNIWRSPYLTYPELGGLSAGEVFNRLASDIRRKCRSGNVKSRIRSRRNEANERYLEYCQYEADMFEACANLVVLRTDLCYVKNLARTIDVNVAIADLNHLVANMRGNAIFRHMIGYIAKIEYAVEKGIHIHFMLFLDGSKRQRASHVYFARQIGEYWAETITKGRGDYWNSNARIRDFMRLGTCGIGPIHANDDMLRRNLRNIVIRYLCKMDQFFRPKSASKVKLIRRGNSPKIPEIKRGRRRKVLVPDPVPVCTGAGVQVSSLSPSDLYGRQIVGRKLSDSDCTDHSAISTVA